MGGGMLTFLNTGVPGLPCTSPGPSLTSAVSRVPLQTDRTHGQHLTSSSWLYESRSVEPRSPLTWLSRNKTSSGLSVSFPAQTPAHRRRKTTKHKTVLLNKTYFAERVLLSTLACNWRSSWAPLARLQGQEGTQAEAPPGAGCTDGLGPGHWHSQVGERAWVPRGEPEIPPYAGHPGPPDSPSPQGANS